MSPSEPVAAVVDDPEDFALIRVVSDSPLCHADSAPAANRLALALLLSLNASALANHTDHGEELQAGLDPDVALDIVSIAVCLFNTLANGFSIAIFLNKAFNRSITSVLLTGLSVFETAFQLGQSGYLTIGLLRDCCLPPVSSRQLAVTLGGLAVLARQASATFQLARNWTLAGLSYYRYEAVCRSTASAKIFKKETCGRLLVGVALLCALVMLPRLFEAFETVCYAESAGYYVLRSTSPYKPVYSNSYYQIFYLSGCLFLLQSGGPVITVLVCSALVLKVLWARQRFRETHNMRRQSATDKLIIMLALTFFVLEMPAFFSKLLYSFKALSKDAEVTLSKFSNMLITLDSSMNIFIYLFSNPTFLQVSGQLLCRRRPASADRRNSSNEETINAAKPWAAVNQQPMNYCNRESPEMEQLMVSPSGGIELLEVRRLDS